MADAAGQPLAGLKVLVVEDQFLIAEEHALILRGMGAAIIGPIKDVASGLDALAGAEPDFAVLDVNLGGDKVFALADALGNRKIPYMFVTGYESWAVPSEYRDTPTLEKPLSRSHLLRAVEQLGVRHPDRAS